MDDTTWFTVAAAAKYAALKPDTIYTACERGDLRHVRVAGRRAIRLRREWLNAWLEQHARGGGTAKNQNCSPVDEAWPAPNTGTGKWGMVSPQPPDDRADAECPGTSRLSKKG